MSLFVVALAVAVAGCTPRQSRDQYQDNLSAAIEVRTTVSAALTNHTYTTAAAYDQASDQVTSTIGQLDADKPPRGLGDAHQRMLDGLDGLQALLSRLGRCEALTTASRQDSQACKQSITQDVYDEIRNDFTEADTIYRQEGLSLPGLGDGGTESGTPDRGDVLDEPSGADKG
jgi:hypothetical protein